MAAATGAGVSVSIDAAGDGGGDEETLGLLGAGKGARQRYKIDTKHPDLPYRAIYCKQERRWVATYDHYCGTLGVPIGERNHGRFWWFLFFQLMSLCWAIGVEHSAFTNALVSDWFSLNAHALFTVIFLYLLTLFVGGLWIFHSWLALTNTTTYEFMRSAKVSGGSPFPCGCCVALPRLPRNSLAFHRRTSCPAHPFSFHHACPLLSVFFGAIAPPPHPQIDYLDGTEDFDLPYSMGVWGNLKVFCCNDGAAVWARQREWKPMPYELPDTAWDKDSEDWWNNPWKNKYWSCC